MSNPSSGTLLERELSALLSERAGAVPTQEPPLLPSAEVVSLDNTRHPGRRTFWLTAAALVVVLGAAVFAVSQSASQVTSSTGVANGPAASAGESASLVGEPSEHIVWLSKDASQNQIDDVAAVLTAQAAVVQFAYVDVDATYAEFEANWSSSPEVVRAIDPQDLPTSFRLTIVGDPEAPLAAIRDLAGVTQIDDELRAFDTLEFVEGEAVLVVVGATWCPHCSENLADYVEVLDSLNSTGELGRVNVVGVELAGATSGSTSDRGTATVWHQSDWPYELMVDDGRSFEDVDGFAIPTIMRWSADGLIGEPLIAGEVSAETLKALLAD